MDEQDFEFAERYNIIKRKRKPSFADKGWLYLYRYVCDFSYPDSDIAKEVLETYVQTDKKLALAFQKAAEEQGDAHNAEAIYDAFNYKDGQHYTDIIDWIRLEALAIQAASYGARYYIERIKKNLQIALIVDGVSSEFGTTCELAELDGDYPRYLYYDTTDFNDELIRCAFKSSFDLANDPDTELENDREGLVAFLGDILGFNCAIELVAEFLGYNTFKVFKNKSTEQILSEVERINALMEKCKANAAKYDGDIGYLDGADSPFLPIDTKQCEPSEAQIKEARKTLKDFTFLRGNGAFIRRLAGRE